MINIKTKIKRIIAALLVAAVASVTVSMSLGSCQQQQNNDNVDNTTEKSDTATEVETDAVESATEKLTPNLPEKDLSGQEFKFYVMGYERNINNYSMEIYAEKETGDVINDAVYKRNKTLEDKYNFVISEFPEKNSSLADTVKNSILAGDDLYQVYMMNLRDSASLAQQGFLYDLNKVEHIDLTKPWWDGKSNADFALMNKLYFAVGDISIMDNNATWAVFFNKKLIADLGLETPYLNVKNNTWTLDKYYELSLAASKDLNGDGVMNPDDDQWGTVGDYLNTYMLYIGSGERVTRKNAEDIPYIDMFNDRSVNVAEKAFDIQLDSNSTLHANKYTGQYANVYSDLIRRNFKEDRALFYIAGMLSYTLLRDMESEFGMVPLPKYDASQESYYTTFNLNNASSLSIPITNQRLEDTGFIVEALMAESMYTLQPAYYEVALERKYMRDEESREMLDIILSSRMFDLSMLYNWGGIYGIFESLTGSNSRNFASEYEKLKDKADVAIEETIQTFSEFEN